jgi:multidrug resistance efflux pump
MIPSNEGHPQAEAAGPAAGQRNGSASLSDRVRSLRLGEPGSSRGGGSRSLTIAWGVSVILLLLTLAMGYRAYRITPASSDEPAQVAEPTRATSTLISPTRAAASGDVVLEAKGYIVAAHQIQVSPKVGGEIIWLDPKLEEGAQYPEGWLLAILEDVDYRADRDRAVATLKNLERLFTRSLELPRPEEVPPSEAKVRVAEANLELQRDLAERAARLYQTRAMSEEDYHQRLLNREIAAKQLAQSRAEHDLLMAGAWKFDKEAAEALKRQAQADLDKAQWKLDNCFIYAPVTGTILTKKAEKGNLVNPLAYSNGLSASLCDMADLADLEVDLSIQERDVSAVFKGQRCTVMPEAFQKYEPFLAKHPHGYDGYVSRLMPIADRAKGALPVRVKVQVPKEEEGVYLKPDMGAVVSFQKPEGK